MLIIQTAFIGDVILATGMVESLAAAFPGISIDVLVKKGNESLLKNSPNIRRVLVFNKKSKSNEVLRVIGIVRRSKYDAVFNLQRFAATGLITGFSGAKFKVGFDKNPVSFLFTKKVKHELAFPKNGHFEVQEHPIHETDRNHQVLATWADVPKHKPKLYPSEGDYEFVKGFAPENYVTMAPGSIWTTKRLPRRKWKDLILKIDSSTPIYLLGSAEDKELNQSILNNAKAENVVNLAGKLTILQSAALMESAKMNYVNDSGPLHIASAMNAPVTAFFLSTIPAFGFGPLSDNSTIIETKHKLACRPCGIHGKTACPEGHFKCSEIRIA